MIDALGPGPVAVDTAVFIYLIEEHPAYLPVVEPLFDEVAAGMREIVTSAVTLLEVLVVPFRTGEVALAGLYEALLTRSRGLRLVEIDRGQLRAAAQLRAHYDLRTPDALQLAAALSSRCSAFVTNDRRLPPLPGLPIMQVSNHR
ncbi:MAG: type II toxin-antitoxin system VapC family toxin [Gemmatimonadaceae bacterium]|nr:type II toxin-antitoxin system VapC family toxin [Gemmatimonadaceae bacterium]